MTDCAGNCGDQLVRSWATPSGRPAGTRLRDRRLVLGQPRPFDRRQGPAGLDGPLGARERHDRVGRQGRPVQFSSLVTTAHASGTGAENTKDGRADLRITDFFILGNPVELTRAGLRAVGGASEQAAYDSGKALLKQLRDHGIGLELPDFDAQLVKSPAHVAVESLGLRVRFEQSVGSVSPAISYPLELGRATAVVAALDVDRKIEVKENPTAA